MNHKADALTRIPGDLPEGGDERLKSMEQVVLKLHNLPQLLRILASDISRQEPPSILSLFERAYQEDPLPNKILEAIRRKCSSKEITVADYMEQDGEVLY